MQLIEALILAVIQGITEWLPVSSSGHLVVAQHFLGIAPDVFFGVALHFGTLLAVITVFRKKIIQLVKGFFSFNVKNESFVQSIFIILATAVTAAIGFAFKDVFEWFFSDLLVVGVALVITGCVLFATKHAEDRRKMNIRDSLIIGLAQGLSITPGLSRSGLTIGAGMLRGVKKKDAAEFSFLLSVPVIIGAFLVEANEVSFSFSFEIVIGIIVSALVGYLAIRFLLGVIRKGAFHYFAYYCWALGAAVLFSLFL